MPKVYIAGKIKGLPIEETELKFATAMKSIFEKGDIAINPVMFIKMHNESLKLSGGIPLSDDCPQQRKEIMKICTDLLTNCDFIYLLPDWTESQGATFEKQVADFFNIPVYNA